MMTYRELASIENRIRDEFAAAMADAKVPNDAGARHVMESIRKINELQTLQQQVIGALWHNIDPDWQQALSEIRVARQNGYLSDVAYEQMISEHYDQEVK
jgi:hypothetical protein